MPLLKPNHVEKTVSETLAEASVPKIKQTNVYSMEPAGLYGTVYEDPRGTNVLRISALVALIVGLVIVFFTGMSAYQHIQKSQEQPASIAALSDQRDQSVPVLLPYVGMLDGQIFDSLSETYSLYQTSDTPTSMTAVRLPDGIDAAKMAQYYQQGIGNLSADEAARLLRTAWFLATDHEDTYRTIQVKFCDFGSSDINYAIDNAIKAQGLDGENSTLLDSGVDSNGNTYKYGSIVRDDGTTVYWLVAACDLDEVYSINGFPAKAFYVGVTESTRELKDLEEKEEEAEAAAAAVAAATAPAEEAPAEEAPAEEAPAEEAPAEEAPAEG